MKAFHRNKDARFHLRLGVIGHVPHWLSQDQEPLAFEPYVREMRIWADLFEEIDICSPQGDGPVRGNVAPYNRLNIRWSPVNYTVLPGQAFKRLVQLPGMTQAVRRTISRNDFVLLRSPGHFGFVGAVLVRAMRRRSITKYSCENGPFEGERLVMRLERRFQAVPNQRNPVLVYGPARSPHQIEFIPALMLDEELAQARSLSSAKPAGPPWKIMVVGRMVPEKGFDLALRGLAHLHNSQPELNWQLMLVGDGYARKDLEALAAQCGIADRVTFAGALSFAQVQECYAKSHVLIMPGVKEGWPKVIAEAWAHGAVAVAARAGIVPYLLQDGNSGCIFDPTPEALSAALARLLSTPEQVQMMATHSFDRAEELSLSQFRARLEKVLVERCGLP